MSKDEVRFLKCVGSKIRYEILQMLGEGEKCVCEIMEELDKEQSLVSHHLQSLKECGLIQKRKEGRKVIYDLADSSIKDFLKNVEDLSKKFC